MNNKMPYINRELSWIDFNYRVLEEALDKTHPVLERFKFLAISASNLDEFFMVRVAGLKEQVKANYRGLDPSGLSSKKQLSAVHEKIKQFAGKQYSYYYKSLLPALKKNNVHIEKISKLSKKERSFVYNYFTEIIFPILTPMAIDKSRPFPLLSNKSLYLGLKLLDSKSKYKFALVQIPGILSRIISVSVDDKKSKYIFIEEIIKEYIEELFTGFQIVSKDLFRITKNFDLSIDEDESEDLLIEIEKSLKQRRFGDIVRLEIEHRGDNDIKAFLVEQLKLADKEVYEIKGIIDFTSLFEFYDKCDRNDLKKSDYTALPPQDFRDNKNIFEIIKSKDYLVHHPFESFDCVLDFIEKAASDPAVLAIKQTLYRVSGDSPIIKSLTKAAENGKQVTVLVEIKARFEEEKNINWARTLEESGCHVIYGLVGLKTHCKATLIVRKEQDGIRRYVHLATGNYNDKTAKLYTDMGLFTTKEKYASDVSSLFNTLSGYSQIPSYNKISTAPHMLRQYFIDLIRHEAALKEKGYIIIKVNSLVDPQIISELYAASSKGVKIDLIVRGICCLRSGLEGISENIKVISVVGDFLEHSRIFFFGNNQDPKIYLSSADWMQRNLDRRVEVLFPIEDEKLKNRIKYILDTYLSDTIKARFQKTDGTYSKIDKRGKPLINSQEKFCREASLEADSHNPENLKVLTPIYSSDIN